MEKYKGVKEVVDGFYEKYIKTPEHLQNLMNKVAEAIGEMEDADLPAVVYVLDTQAKGLRNHPGFVDLTGVPERVYGVDIIVTARVEKI